MTVEIENSGLQPHFPVVARIEMPRLRLHSTISEQVETTENQLIHPSFVVAAKRTEVHFLPWAVGVSNLDWSLVVPYADRPGCADSLCAPGVRWVQFFSYSQFVLRRLIASPSLGRTAN